MRRGVTLIELVAVLPILTIVALLLSRLFPVLVWDVPQMRRTVQTHSTVESVLRQLRGDVEAAEALPDAFSGQTAGDRLLLIRRPTCVVSYQIVDKEIVRRLWQHGADPPAKATHTWPRDKAEICFRRWMAGDKAYAVEVQSSVRATRHGQTLYKLATAAVLYPGALAGRRERP